MKVGGLTITLHYSDFPRAEEEAHERIILLQDGLVVTYAIPCMKRGDLEALMSQLSRLVQRDTLLDTSKKN